MTGKELLLVLGGAAALGGAAGAGYAVVSSMQDEVPAAVVADNSELGARMDQLERSQARTNEALDKLSGTLSGMSEQLTRMDLEAKQRVPAARLGRAQRPMATDHGASEDVDIDKVEDVVRGFKVVGPDGEPVGLHGRLVQDADIAKLMERNGEIGKAIQDALNAAETSLPEELQGKLGGMMKAMELRKLPVEERWQKAQDELGLDYYQVDELKKAVADRDQAMKDAMVVEKDETDGGSHVVIKRLDPGKASEAQKNYRNRVNEVLRDDQKDGWRDNGYDNAFGRGGGGTMVAITNSVTHKFGEEKTDEVEDE